MTWEFSKMSTQKADVGLTGHKNSEWDSNWEKSLWPSWSFFDIVDSLAAASQLIFEEWNIRSWVDGTSHYNSSLKNKLFGCIQEHKLALPNIKQSYFMFSSVVKKSPHICCLLCLFWSDVCIWVQVCVYKWKYVCIYMYIFKYIYCIYMCAHTLVMKFHRTSMSDVNDS